MPWSRTGNIPLGFMMMTAEWGGGECFEKRAEKSGREEGIAGTINPTLLLANTIGKHSCDRKCVDETRAHMVLTVILGVFVPHVHAACRARVIIFVLLSLVVPESYGPLRRVRLMKRPRSARRTLSQIDQQSLS